jgi:hypothetical protein
VTTTARGLQTVRAAYGAALVLLPGPVIWLATGQLPSRRSCRVAQVLGIRHLIQAAVTAAAPEPAVLAIGGQVDAVHAASMLALAAVSRAGRRAALTDALTEAAFAAAGRISVANSVTGADEPALLDATGEAQDRMNRSTALAKPSSSLDVVTRRAARWTSWLALPMAMLSPEWANMSTSLGWSPIVAICSGGIW